jgi:hypothetical protein
MLILKVWQCSMYLTGHLRTGRVPQIHGQPTLTTGVDGSRRRLEDSPEDSPEDELHTGEQHEHDAKPHRVELIG